MRQALIRRVIALLALGLLAGTAAWAIKPEEVVEVRVEPPRVQLAPGGTARVTVVAEIREGFHTNSNQPTLEYLVPTKVELAPPSAGQAGAAGFTLEAKYPKGELKAFGFAPDEELSVYEGTVKMPVVLKAAGAKVGRHELRVLVQYQACNDQLCLRPTKKEAKLVAEVLPK